MNQEKKNNVCLVIIDGYGINKNKEYKYDATREAYTPCLDKIKKLASYRELKAAGHEVGIPEGQTGNSKVGHMTTGCGRVVYQDKVRIDLVVKNGEMGKVENVKQAFETAKRKNGRLHFCGLLSDGGVHSDIEHLRALIAAAMTAGVPECYVHGIADGRDSEQYSVLRYVEELEREMQESGYGKIASVVGRYYAMDRTRRWERIKVAFDSMTQGVGECSMDLVGTMKQRFESTEETDETLGPIISVGADQQKVGLIGDGDTVFFFNFRSDRMRFLVQAFGQRPVPIDSALPDNLDIFTMTSYKESFPFRPAFPPQSMANSLPEWLDKHGVQQCYIAESEKFAYLTFFFNGGNEQQFATENRILVQSPIAQSYEATPDMSVKDVAEVTCQALASNAYQLVVANLAAPDILAHTGNFHATCKAVEATDMAIQRIYNSCIHNNYTLIITSDHGNCEVMVDSNNNINCDHTASPVPFVVVDNDVKLLNAPDLSLCDIAPTVLHYMGYSIPPEMTGRSLLL